MARPAALRLLPVCCSCGAAAWHAMQRVLASRLRLYDLRPLRVNMKLFTKGLLLIAVPSAVELALLGVVFDTQEQTAQAAQWVDNSKQILYQSSAMVDPLLREAARVRAAMVTGDASLIDRHAVWVDLGDRLAALDALVAQTPQ